MSLRDHNDKLGDRRREQGQRGKKRKPLPEAPTGPLKVRLDARTGITLCNHKALAFWLKRYPGATIINPITE